MSYGEVEIRAQLVAAMDAFEALYPEIPVEYQNVESIDLDNAPDVFVCFHVLFNFSRQANIAPSPFKRRYGRVRATCFVKENLGSVKAMNVLAAIEQIFEFQTLGGTHLECAVPGGEGADKGWYSRTVSIPFFADSNAQ
jgi:hypothetical protein